MARAALAIPCLVCRRPFSYFSGYRCPRCENGAFCSRQCFEQRRPVEHLTCQRVDLALTALTTDELLLRRLNRTLLAFICAAFRYVAATLRLLLPRDRIFVVRYTGEPLLVPAYSEVHFTDSLASDLVYRYLRDSRRHLLWAPLARSTEDELPRRVRDMHLQLLPPSVAGRFALCDVARSPDEVNRWLALGTTHHLALLMATTEGVTRASCCSLITVLYAT